jgi:hypothetical protein
MIIGEAAVLSVILHFTERCETLEHVALVYCMYARNVWYFYR